MNVIQPTAGVIIPVQNIAQIVTPLQESKSIVLTLVPNWSPKEPKPLRPDSLKVLWGPKGVTPATAPCCFEFNVISEDPSNRSTDPNDEFLLGNGQFVQENPTVELSQRKLLWEGGQPFDQFKNCVVTSGCKLDYPNLGLTSISIRALMRHPIGEVSKNNLMFRNIRVKERKDLSYLRIFENYHYHLNFTFAIGSVIAQKIHYEGWIPAIYLCSKEEVEGKDIIKSETNFANFNTNWGLGIEAPATQKEKDAAKKALEREVEEDAAYAKEIQKEKDLALRVNGEGFIQELSELLNQKLDQQEKTFLDTTFKRYTLPNTFKAALFYGIFRIWNAIKTLFPFFFGKSDWMIAHTIVKRTIESAPWFQHLRNKQAILLTDSFMNEGIKKGLTMEFFKG